MAFEDAKENYTGAVIHCTKNNFEWTSSSDHPLRKDAKLLESQFNVHRTELKHIYTVTLHYYSSQARHDAIRKIDEINGIDVLAIIEYGGYVVEKVYEETEYRSKIVTSTNDA